MKVWFYSATDNILQKEASGNSVQISLDQKKTLWENFSDTINILVMGVESGLLECKSKEDGIDNILTWMATNDPDGSGIRSKSMLIYDGTVIEWEATPGMVGIEENDIVLMVDKSCLVGAKSNVRSEEHISILSDYFKRTCKNTPMFGLPFIPILLRYCLHGHVTEDSKEKCSSLYTVIEISVERFCEILESLSSESNGQMLKNGLKEIKSKLKRNVYKHAYQCILDVHRHMCEWKTYALSSKTDLVTFNDLVELYNRFFCVLPEASWRKREDWQHFPEDEQIVPDMKSLKTVVIGPVRDAHIRKIIQSSFIHNCSTDELTLSWLSGDKITLQDLMDSYHAYIYSYHEYTQKLLDFSKIDFSQFCQGQSTDKNHEHNIQCLIEPVFKFQKSIGIPQYFQLRLPLKEAFKKSPSKDEVKVTGDKNLNELLRYIEGDKEKPIKKKKKKKKILANNTDIKEESESNTMESSSEDHEKGLKVDERVIVDGASATVPETVLETNETDDDDTEFTVVERHRPKVRQNKPTEFYIKDQKPTGKQKGKVPYTTERTSRSTAVPIQPSGEKTQRSKVVRKMQPNHKIEKKVLVQETKLVRIESSAEPIDPVKENQKSKLPSTTEKAPGSTVVPDQLSNERTELSKVVNKLQPNHRFKLEEKLHLQEIELVKIKSSEELLMNENKDYLMELQKKLTDSEDKIQANHKLCNQLDSDIEELEKQKRDKETRKADILLQNSKLTDEYEKHRKDQIRLQNEIDEKLDILKRNKLAMFHDIKHLKEQLSLSKMDNDQSLTGTTKMPLPKVTKSFNQGGNSEFDLLLQQQLKQQEVKLLQEQIKEMESTLECPVCLEVSQTPIYMCHEQHIICSICWPKVNFQF